MNPSLRLKFKGLTTSLIMLAIAALFAVLLSCDRIYAADSAFTGVTQSGATTSSVDIRFKPGSQSSGNRYTALIGTSKTGDFSETEVITALNSLTLTGLKDGSTYYIKIASCDEEGMLTGEESQPFAVVTAPGGTPSYISQSESGVDSVTVVWASVSGATGYYVEYSLADSTTGSKERMSVSSESAAIKGILSSKVYSVTVYPYRSSGAFTAFDKSTAVTLGNVAIRDQGTGGTPSGKVTGLKQTGAESDKVTVLMRQQPIRKTQDEIMTPEKVLERVRSQLLDRAAKAQKFGTKQNRIVLDPGIGFESSPSLDLEIIRQLRQISLLGYPLLIGPSRKSFIGKYLHRPVEERSAGTAAVICSAILNGCDIIRVHDVKFMKDIAVMSDLLRK